MAAALPSACASLIVPFYRRSGEKAKHNSALQDFAAPLAGNVLFFPYWLR